MMQVRGVGLEVCVPLLCMGETQTPFCDHLLTQSLATSSCSSIYQGQLYYSGQKSAF